MSRLRSERDGFYSNRVEILSLGEFFEKYPKIAEQRRWRIFQSQFFTCVSCGVIGTHVIVWEEHSSPFNTMLGKFYNPPSRHYDLATANSLGRKRDFIMMTVDHRIPRSKGGRYKLDNLDCMCQPCNSYKKDVLPKGSLERV